MAAQKAEGFLNWLKSRVSFYIIVCILIIVFLSGRLTEVYSFVAEIIKIIAIPAAIVAFFYWIAYLIKTKRIIV